MFTVGSEVYCGETDRFEMPVTFGNRELGPVAGYKDTFSLSISFLADRDAIAELLPPSLSPGDEGVVTVGYRMVRGAARLRGRGYNIVRVDLESVYEDAQDVFRAPYAVIMWESSPDSVQTGREYYGVGKLFADIPDLDPAGSEWHFECSEYGTRLLEANTTDMKAVPPREVANLDDRGRFESSYLNWKYIPGLDGRAEVDYLTTVDSWFEPKEAWVGAGTVHFELPDYQSAPVSHRVMVGLETLRPLEYKGAVATRGPVEIDRTASKTFKSDLS
jgi:hypothetical protein